MRNLVLLVSLGLGISVCFYYFSTNTQDTSPIAQEKIIENSANGNENTIDRRAAYDLLKQNQQSLICVGSKTNTLAINADENGSTTDLIQDGTLGNVPKNLNLGAERRVAFFGQYRLQKFMHRHKLEGCACTLPNNDRTIEKKLSVPNWLRAIQGIQKN